MEDIVLLRIHSLHFLNISQPILHPREKIRKRTEALGKLQRKTGEKDDETWMEERMIQNRVTFACGEGREDLVILFLSPVCLQAGFQLCSPFLCLAVLIWAQLFKHY